MDSLKTIIEECLDNFCQKLQRVRIDMRRKYTELSNNINNKYNARNFILKGHMPLNHPEYKGTQYGIMI